MQKRGEPKLSRKFPIMDCRHSGKDFTQHSGWRFWRDRVSTRKEAYAFEVREPKAPKGFGRVAATGKSKAENLFYHTTKYGIKRWIETYSEPDPKMMIA